MAQSVERSFTVASSIDEALVARRQGAAVLAGGTWMMRDPLRGVDLPEAVVALHRIPALSEVEVDPDHTVIGAVVTHAVLGRALRGLAGFEALVGAADGAANPGIRRVATVGGNLCTLDFAAADLAPALLVCEATVEMETFDGPKLIGISDFLRDRPTLLADAILTKVHLRRDLIASAHIRLPLRMAGDYPVAIVSIAVDKDKRFRIAVGSVEPIARRWTALEEALAAEPGGFALNPERVTELAAEHNDFHGRDSTEAEGWYRRQVLPALVKRGLAAFLKTEGLA
ncbi:FAD binding domain-containing protein [Mesorhizobium sp. YR577]|uniref:FAD binding domain-containing protein n=1 Tax=Mesorhizobium sp. YR577 TaxID=1884373 RepID=UPI0008E5CF3E|nr:FAD binding domain-containing protein [Mesorhizobium sp. YR577]SFU19497.1 carbon-monoxide dehydrogenase medium subunit [Mesorhizobium sp. YR577]